MSTNNTENYGATYADLFDDIYTKLDYTPEYIIETLDCKPNSHILDLGCGTGRNSQNLPYKITGIDLSKHMLAIAQQKMPKHHWEHSSITNFKLPTKYDGAIMLGDILSYLTINSELCEAFQNISNHLQSKAKLIFDFWYGPAVLTHKPGTTTKQLGYATRQATSILDIPNNICTVNYTFTQSHKRTYHEQHKIRYFTIPEVHLLMALFGFHPQYNDNPPTENDWHTTIVAIKD